MRGSWKLATFEFQREAFANLSHSWRSPWCSGSLGFVGDSWSLFQLSVNSRAAQTPTSTLCGCLSKHFVFWWCVVFFCMPTSPWSNTSTKRPPHATANYGECDKSVVVLDRSYTTQLVLALVTCRLDYCNSAVASLPQSTVEPLQRVQNAATRIIF